jgi:SAM-dependent methyltransferase
MTAWKLFAGDVAKVSTPEYHADRERATHLEEDGHRQRLLCAARLVLIAQKHLGRAVTVSDLGCGDGGLLSLVQHHVAEAWGYDFTPANAAGWAERGVKAEALDVFGADAALTRFGDVTVMTEVLEHLTDPYAVVRWVESPYLVASSPWNENDKDFSDCHSWAFDRNGYRALIEGGGYRILQHINVRRFQVVSAVRE